MEVLLYPGKLDLGYWRKRAIRLTLAIRRERIGGVIKRND
jgi:hypothetical protein